MQWIQSTEVLMECPFTLLRPGIENLAQETFNILGRTMAQLDSNSNNWLVKGKLYHLETMGLNHTEILIFGTARADMFIFSVWFFFFLVSHRLSFLLGLLLLSSSITFYCWSIISHKILPRCWKLSLKYCPSYIYLGQNLISGNGHWGRGIDFMASEVL